MQPVVLDVLHHADHLPPGILSKRAGPNALAERARGLGGQLASEVLGNRRPRGRPSRCRSKSRRVRRSAACPWRRNIPARRGSICAPAGSLPAPPFGLRPLPSPLFRPVHRNVTRETGSHVTPGSAAILSSISRSTRVICPASRDTAGRNPNPRGLNRRRIRKAGIDVAQRLRRANHERRAHDEHDRQRDLHDDQRVACRAPLAACARSARSAGERCIVDCSACLSAVTEPNTSAEANEMRHAECEHRRIDGDLLKARQVARADGDQRPQACVGERETDHAAGRAQDQALDEQLARDSRPVSRRARRARRTPAAARPRARA